ncbi:hypothetical protein HZC07_02280 [Candidatus Micrarchaeota archaeon]|nr:hypothetical protein [Candidatus Micrarchaeota archaeon]
MMEKLFTNKNKMGNLGMVIAVVMLLCSVSFAGLSVSNWTVSQKTYKPGANGVLTVDISNPLVSGVNVKTVDAVTADITTPPEITTQGQQFIGSVEPGGVNKISIPFKVISTAKNFIYQIVVQLSGTAQKDEGGIDSFSRRVSIPVNVVNVPVITISTDKQVLNGIDSVGMIVKNEGGAATNIKVGFPQTSAIGFYGATQAYLPEIGGNKTALINVTLDSRAASDGPVTVPLIVSYDDDLGISYNDSYNLRATVKKEKVDLSFLQKSVIRTRNESTAVLAIKNNGNAILKEVQLSFKDASVRLRDSNQLSFGDIYPNQISETNATILANLPPGLNLVNVTLSWVEKDVQKEQEITFPLTLSSDSDVAVYLEAKPSPITAGGEHTLSVLVSNVGSYQIDNVQVTLASDSLKSLDISNQRYIGSLKNDDFSSVQFKIRANDVAEGSYPVNVNISYRDQSGQWITKSNVQMINIYKAESKNGNPLLIILPVALVAIGVWYFKFRKTPNK